MNKLAGVGRSFLAIGMVVFGAQHFVYMDFVTRVFPKLPVWIPAHSFLACVFGAILIAACVAIMIEKVARSLALLLGVVILSSLHCHSCHWLSQRPSLPINGGLWARAGKALAISRWSLSEP
jgi:uncharacterized membrane protein